jgi:signal peptidase I
MEPKKENFLHEIVKFSLIALLVVLPIRLFIAQPFIVRGASMDPTFHTGDYVIVDQLTYRFEQPKRGDVIIFHHPDNEGVYLIKRIIGLPGESIEISGKDVIIRNKANGTSFVYDQSFLAPERLSSDFPPITQLDPGEYFVMGDNRTQSSDSRVWGPLPEAFIVGRALVRLYPFTQVGLFPGFVNEKVATANTTQ